MAEIMNKNGLTGPRALQLWMPRLTSADVEFSAARPVAAGRARELHQTSPYAANAARIHRDNVIGPRFTLAMRPVAKILGISVEQAKEWAKLVEAEWEAYANAPTFDVDAGRSLTWPWMLQQAYLTFLHSGEALGILKGKLGFQGYRTCLLMVEPERLSNPPEKIASIECRDGVEVDRDGAPVAYYIRDSHPSDVLASFSNPSRATTWTRVARYASRGRPQVLHLVDRTRPDMRRGISGFASAISSLKMGSEFDTAALEAAILQSSVAAVIQTELGSEDAFKVMGSKTGYGEEDAPNPFAAGSLDYMKGIAGYVKEQQMTLNGAKVVHLMPNEKLELLQAEIEGQQYEAFTNALARKLAAGLGTTVEQLTRDFSKMTFASAKQSLGEIWRHFLSRRELVVRQLAMPYVGAWLEEAIDIGRLPMPNGKRGNADDFMAVRAAVLSRSTFMSWGAPQVDPVKEREGQALALKLGLSTLQEEAQAQGQDWEEIAEQRALEIKTQERLGMPPAHELDTPPPPPGGPGGPERDAAGNPTDNG